MTILERKKIKHKTCLPDFICLAAHKAADAEAAATALFRWNTRTTSCGRAMIFITSRTARRGPRGQKAG